MKTKILLTAFLLLSSLSNWAQLPSYLPANGLVAWYPFNGNANDESGNGYDGIANGGEFINNRLGESNKAISLIGQSNSIQVNNLTNFNYQNALAISFWIYVESLPASGEEILFSQQTNSSTSAVGFNVSLAASGELNFRLGNGSTSTFSGVLFNQITLNQWTHVVCQHENGLSEVYLNSVFSNDFSQANAVIGTSGTQLIIGDATWIASNALNYDGKIDDIGIWNRALTPQEVASIYSGQAPCQNTSGSIAASISIGETYSFNGQNLTAAGTYTATLQNAAGCDSVVTLNLEVNATPLQCEVIPSATSICAGNETNININTSGGNIQSNLFPLQGSSVRYTFTGNANDESGSGNDGIIYGASSTAGQSGLTNSAYLFNSADSDFINLPQPFLGGGQVSTFTMHARVKANSIANSPNIWGKTLFWGEVNFLIGNDGSVALFWANSITGNKYSSIYTNPGIIQAAQWYDIVVAYGSSSGIIYVNGTEVPTNLGWSAQGGAFISNTQIEATCNFAQDQGSSRFGVRNTGGSWGNYLDGVIDEFNVWNRSLSLSEIESISGISQASILWSTGEITPSISVSPTETTTYSVTVTQGGQTCTSEVTITVNQPSAETVNATITEGEMYNFNGQSLTTAGTYTATLQNASGCDSVVTLNLTVEPAVEPLNCEITANNNTICSGEAVALGVNNISSINANLQLPSAFTLLTEFNGKKYYLFDQMIPWEQAKTIGDDLGISMYIVNSPEEELVVYQALPQTGTDGIHYWLGLYQDFSDSSFSEPAGAWKWVDGTSLNSEYTNWEIGEPNNADGGETYAQFEWSDDGIKWNDAGFPAVQGTQISKPIYEVPVGAASASILWSTGETTPSISVSPSETTTYSVTVTQGNQTCTSEVTITVNQPSAETVNATITEGETYNFNGQSITAAGTYTATLQNAAGCDSVVTLNLTVEPAVEPLNCEITASETSTCLNGQVSLSTTYSGSVQSTGSTAWQLIGNLPEARGSAAGYIDNGKIWIHAGANSVEIRPASMFFDLTTNTGGYSSNIPFPRGEVGYGRVNDKFYVIGGYTGSSASNNTQEYDLVNGTWTSKANMPTSRSVLSSAVLNNQIYVIGGWPGTQNTFERYTPESNTWETLPTIPTARHSVNSAAAIDNKVYFLSGKDAWMTQFYSANECFDPATNSWQTKAPVPQPVYGGAAASHNGKLYLVGGSTGSYNSYINGSQTLFKTVQIYDPATDTWSMGPELPVATSLATLVSDGVDLYLVGGMSKNDNESQWYISSSIYKLSNTSQTSILWSTGETTPSISVSPTETTTYSVTVTQGNQTCTSEVTITVNQPSAETVNATITEGETYNFNGQNLTTAGIYTANLQNAAGCDSVVTLNLTVNPAPVGGCYASTVINFSQGQRADAANVAAIRSNPEQALGMPEPVVTNVVNFVSLGFGGSITLAFETPIANGAGNDIRIDEATWNNNPCNRYPERADVFASQDGVNFVYLGVACQDASFDLGTLSWAQYVRIVDVSDLLSFNPDADGFDVNGIECLNGAATSLSDDGLVACSLQEIVSYTPGNRKNGTAVGSPRNNPANALGTPQNNNTINFTALGFGGTLVAKFDYVVFNQPGNDLRVTETSFGNPSCTNYPEKARVSVSMDNVIWTELGEICQDGEIDLGAVNYAQYIKIQDASPMSSNKFNGAADGYDVDAVVVLNNGCGTSSARLAQFDNTETPDDAIALSLFPNPMEDYTVISLEGLGSDVTFNLEIIDAAGRVIRSNSIEIQNGTYLFRASDLAPGVYQVVLQNEHYRFSQRLLK